MGTPNDQERERSDEEDGRFRRAPKVALDDVIMIVVAPVLLAAAVAMLL